MGGTASVLAERAVLRIFDKETTRICSYSGICIGLQYDHNCGKFAAAQLVTTNLSTVCPCLEVVVAQVTVWSACARTLSRGAS
jgi:hypothetical protein